jgi:SAM-dependent methyltransferase
MSDDTAALNRDVWTRKNAEHTDPKATDDWAQREISWGLFAKPERELKILGDVSGLDVVELGCGTAYFSAWLARRGARPVGVDVNPAQLETARRCQRQFELSFPLVEANAERVPLPAASFDLALSEYGACLWCEPELWVAEAARLLRPGGRLIFLTNSALVTMCLPDVGCAGTELLRGPRETERLQWPGNEGVEFHLAHGEWISLLARHGFAVERLAELHAPPDAAQHEFYEIATPEWAQRWPIEEIWVARRA